jgi:hypothetical protein
MPESHIVVAVQVPQETEVNRRKLSIIARNPQAEEHLVNLIAGPLVALAAR